MSTGVIGSMLPMEKIHAGIQAAASELGDDEQSLENAARGIMTTDTVPKIRGREVTIGGVPTRITGIAKGAAMIGPNMATMLSLVMTDACLRKQDAQAALVDAVDESFHCISVDGHMSTNDTVILLANGAATQRVRGSIASDTALRARPSTTSARRCSKSAKTSPNRSRPTAKARRTSSRSKSTAAASRPDALQIGKTIADSPLVKTAIAGADPNWGRIVSAAGYAGVQFDPSKVTLHLNGLLLYERGAPVDFDRRRRLQIDRRRSRHEHRAHSRRRQSVRPASGRPISRPNTCG